MSAFLQDLLYGFRVLIKRPGFTVVAVISLALGIAANSTIFSLINGLLLNALDYQESDRLVILWNAPVQRPDARQSASYKDFIAWRDRARSFESIGTLFGDPLNIGRAEDGSAPEQISVQHLSPSMFHLLRVQPALGRLYTEDEDRPGDPAPVILLSYKYWQRRYKGSPNVVNQKITADGIPTTIIGVMPSGFDFADQDTDAWIPSGYSRAQMNSNATFLVVAARLKPGVTIAQAQEEMNAIGAQMKTEAPERRKNLNIRVQSMADAFYGGARNPLLILQGVVAFVLLIACANVAGLLLARASSRQTEMSVRAALGAGRGRIVRQLLTESVLLAILGGFVGSALAWAGLRIFAATVPQGFPRLTHVNMNPKVLLFTAGISILTGVLFGLVPALQASRMSLAGSLRESGRSAMTSAGRNRLRSTLVIGQIGLALVLLIGSGLLINSFLRLQRNELGVDSKGLLTFELRFPQNQMMKLVSSYRGVGLWDIFPVTSSTFTRVQERLQAIPGVQSVAGSGHRPLAGSMGMPFLIEGKPVADSGETGQPAQNAGYYAVTPGYFETLKIPVLRGRSFTAQDTASSTPVIAINQTMARRYWPSEDPIGKRIILDFVPNERPREIVAVVGDTRTFRAQKEFNPILFVPYVQQSAQWQGPSWNERAGMTFLLRTSGDPLSVVSAVRSAVAEIDASKPLTQIQTMETYLDDQIAYDRLFTVLLGIFGVIAAILAAVGIYGVMAYMVAQRTQEIGIRMALGASRSAVVALVLRHALILTAIGLLIGLGGSYAMTGLISSQLWGITATDPVTFIAVSALLILVAATASLIPTRRAVQVDPNVALRYE